MKRLVVPIVLACTVPSVFAQAPAEQKLSAPVEASAPVIKRLPRVVFHGAAMAEMITYLQVAAEKAGAPPLNVVLQPGVEELLLPALTLQNVSPEEALSVLVTVLNLQMEPVPSEDGGKPAAWIVKLPAGEGAAIGAVAGAIIRGSGGADGGLNPAAVSLNPIVTGAPGLGVNTPPAPQVVRLGASASDVSGGMGAPAPAPQSRVFPIMSLLDGSEKERTEKLDRLLMVIEKMAKESTTSKVDVNAYGEMGLLVVKSTDPAAIVLVSEAIEALKSNQSAAQKIQALEDRARVIQAEISAKEAALVAQQERTQAALEMAERSRLSALESAQRAAAAAKDAAKESIGRAREATEKVQDKPSIKR